MEKINIGDKVILKKQHACGNNLWEVTRLGVDLKLKCLGCNHEIMMSRVDFEKRLKKKVDEKVE